MVRVIVIVPQPPVAVAVPVAAGVVSTQATVILTGHVITGAGPAVTVKVLLQVTGA